MEGYSFSSEGTAFFRKQLVYTSIHLWIEYVSMQWVNFDFVQNLIRPRLLLFSFAVDGRGQPLH